MDLFDVHLVQYITLGKGLVKDPCASRKHKLLSVLNLLCNVTQNTSVVSRDACYGCFFRAALLTNGAILLTQLSVCATTYLNNSVYQTCATQLDLVATGLTATSAPTTNNCYTGYCQFVQCIRRVNSYQLIDTCLLASLSTSSLVNQTGRVNFFTNTTSCILAASRCNSYNPITGIFQGTYGSQAQLNQYLAQVTSSLRPVLPVEILEFSSASSNLFLDLNSKLSIRFSKLPI